MQKFNNYVLMTICELIFNKHNASNFSNVMSYHKHYKFIYKDMISNRLVLPSDLKKIDSLIDEIIVELNLIYGFGMNESCLFISYFYSLDDDRVNNMFTSIKLLDHLINFKGC
jgi:hypothetical protein